ncbi:DUF5333 domain-containing protein [Cochlodiniinecator piscidefendens]|uniref:DUF5333 domain-containing protein n=1 Tax=Cochlodiniinecator piscidefendens TaxID=2715756 RepID=UPI00140A297C|nr:DUF5333 domain-containing protein [Cochlodiniinecator piscidefendens]
MMMRTRIISMVAATCLSSQAWGEGIADVDGVTNGLITAGIVETIDDTCTTISVRKIRGLLYLRSLYNMASNAGFEHAEIEAYVDDEDEEARLRARADAWLASEGAVTGDEESYCAVGRDHIARATQIGVLLRAE